MYPQDGKFFRALLDTDQYHRDDVTVVGEASSPVPSGINRDGIPFGGHESTAFNAVNYIKVDYEAAARRNIEDTKRRIALRLEHEKKTELTGVV